jgi:hypothetical protein
VQQKPDLVKPRYRGQESQHKREEVKHDLMIYLWIGNGENSTPLIGSRSPASFGRAEILHVRLVA